MGLPISIHLRTVGDEYDVEGAVASAFHELRAADALFSPYRPDSGLCQLARGEVTLDALPRHFRSVLAMADRAREMTDGAFDVWASGRLDPNGIVKGWAAERAAGLLPGDCYLNAGGDMAIRSTNRPWRIGIEHPHDPSGLLAVLTIASAGVATSGSAHRGQHIIDPSSGTPAVSIIQATVVGPRLTVADIWATAIIARGSRVLDRADPLVPRLVRGGYSVLLLDEDGVAWSSANFAAHYAPDQPRPTTHQLN